MMNKKFWFLGCFLWVTFTVFGQGYWHKVDFSVRRNTTEEAANVQYFTLDKAAFGRALEGSQTGRNGTIVEIPNADGELISYEVRPTEVLAENLAKKYPHIKTFEGIAVEHPEHHIRFTWSNYGLDAIMQQNLQYDFVESENREGTYYRVYHYKDTERTRIDCQTPSEASPSLSTNRPPFVATNKHRTFRIAIACTHQYTEYFWGKNQAFTQIVNTLNRVNEVYGQQLSVSFLLVSDDSIVFDNKDTDPFTGLDFQSWYQDKASVLQDLLDNKVGNANYDIGHLFHNASEGGNAGCIGCVCNSDRKGQGFSSYPFAFMGRFRSAFDFDVVAHELGHQLGAFHTFSYKREGGSDSQMEPGSGTTIMSYAGVTRYYDLQSHNDPYFHHRSVYDIATTLQYTSCATEKPINNLPPEIADLKAFTIPKGTAYMLEGSATDADGDSLLYTWEQSDNYTDSSYYFSSYATMGANARSLPPSANSFRYIPRLERIVAGTLVQQYPKKNDDWETVSSVGRTLHWTFMVLDRPRAAGQQGNTVYKTIEVAVSQNAGPFKVASQKQPETWYIGEKVTIEWNVAGTNRAPINAFKMKVLFSTDGGKTFSHTLATDLPNNGKAEIVVPKEIRTGLGRLMIKAEDNIFLAVNTATITVREPVDTDSDGIADIKDNCPRTYNPDQSDLDSDGIGDVCDEDIDGDGVANTKDNCPKTYNPDQSDLDKDGIGDACDEDVDGDGVINTKDNCPKAYNPDQSDIDNDGIGDVCDEDIDGDGIPNGGDEQQEEVLVANAFSPNGDGINDTYTILRIEHYPKNVLKVYNTFGEEVYYAEGYHNQWDGKHRGKLLPQGPYWVILSLDGTEKKKRAYWIYINY